MDDTIVRFAEQADIEAIMGVFDIARRYMRASGNLQQWTDGYPGRALIMGEIEAEHCYVIVSRGKVVGTFCLIIGEDPTYAVIEDGHWLNACPYGTIHRLASDGTVSGIAQIVIEFCWSRIENLRIDTHQDNLKVRQILERSGFTRCGIIHVSDGSPRIAYQKSSELKMQLQRLVPERFISDAKYRKWHISVVNPLQGTCLLGVHIPELKFLAKKILKGEWQASADGNAATPDTGKHETAHQDYIDFGIHKSADGVASGGDSEKILGSCCDSGMSVALRILDGFERHASLASRPDAADVLCHEEKLLWGLLLDGLLNSAELMQPLCGGTSKFTEISWSLGVHETAGATQSPHPASKSDSTSYLPHDTDEVTYVVASADDLLRRVRTYISLISNWAECDTFCCNANWRLCPSVLRMVGTDHEEGKTSVSIGEKHSSRAGSIAAEKSAAREALWQFILPYFSSLREFEVRFAIVTAICNFLDEEYIDKVFAQLHEIDYGSIETAYNDLKINLYYVKMAVAWLLASALANKPERTRSFLRSAALPPDVISLYVRKARESFRTRTVSPF